MIRVDENIIIEVDTFSYIAKADKHKQDKNGVDMFELIGYYSTLESALKGILRYKVARALDVKEFSLNEAIREVQRVKNEFGERIDEIIGVG